MEVEIRALLQAEVEDGIANREYSEGFRTGKEAGLAENAEHAYEAGLIEGYKEALDTKDLLSCLRNGSISADSPGLEYLFDFDHPRCPYNRGRQIGMPEKSKKRVK